MSEKRTGWVIGWIAGCVGGSASVAVGGWHGVLICVGIGIVSIVIRETTVG